MRLLGLLLAVVALSLALAVAAPAGVVHVDWHEQATIAGKPRIAFHVQTFVGRTKGKLSGWAVVATVTNRTAKPLRISRNQFGLALFPNAKATDPGQAKLMPAAAFSPPLPNVIGPGKSWKGTFAGVGVPPDGAYVRVLFGWFSGPAVGGSGFNWLSDHVQRWCAGACSTFGA